MDGHEEEGHRRRPGIDLRALVGGLLKVVNASAGYEEFVKGLEVLRLRPPAASTATKSLFETCDTDQTGTLSFAQAK